MDWDAPGIRSRSAPMVRAAPPPSAYTPATSRVAMPAIFCTTPSAMVVRPCGVCSPSGDACAATARPDVDVVLVDGVGLLMGSPELCACAFCHSLAPDGTWLRVDCPDVGCSER